MSGGTFVAVGEKTYGPLIPCPVCGNTHLILRYIPFGYAEAGCGVCGNYSSLGSGDTKDEALNSAVEAWNSQLAKERG